VAFFSLVSALPWHLPVDAAAHGPALDRHLLLNLWIALGLLTLVHVILVTGLVVPRRTAEPRRAWLAETLPLVLLTLLFATLTVRSERLWAAARYTGADLAALQVEATGMQFAWYFRYPGADATFGRTDPRRIAPGEGNPLGLDPADPHGHDDLVTAQLFLPAGREVDLRLNAQDVIHGFSVPQLRLKQNAIPGQPTHIHFTPTLPGTYAILCTQVCGLGHYRMQANLVVLPQEEYTNWIALSQKALREKASREKASREKASREKAATP